MKKKTHFPVVYKEMGREKERESKYFFLPHELLGPCIAGCRLTATSNNFV